MSLNSFLIAALSFAAGALIIAMLTALVVNALYTIWLRAPINRSLVRGWLRTRSNAEETFELVVKYGGSSNEQAFFGLTYAQLCGQLASALQTSVESGRDEQFLRLFARSADPDDMKRVLRSRDGSPAVGVEPSSPEDAGARRRVLAHAQLGLDGLQSWLSLSWARANYLYSFLCAQVLTLSVLWVERETFGPTLRVTIASILLASVATLLVPVVSRLADRIVGNIP